MAYGYPIESAVYTQTFGTPVGLYDCLGCTSYEAGFTKELLLGTSDPELAALPLSDGWLTPADLLCVLDDIYTYDVIEEAALMGGEAAHGGLDAATVVVAALVACLAVQLLLMARYGRAWYAQRLASLRRRAPAEERRLEELTPGAEGYDMRPVGKLVV